ncbi:uncharacterized protein EKO05_0003799 [Ascochyta rabiei]|uniref:uncharacterized protein n=1 Tax=Didymella rabiei TaxID=5454 RepID=UPI0021FC8382|nr:uncharacterized protein EKO05_0003799 [Ascochyta rabiei]UPX13283.1 hypothetical protein EKO05_0003799 [Ascochyta rabiei]
MQRRGVGGERCRAGRRSARQNDRAAEEPSSRMTEQQNGRAAEERSSRRTEQQKNGAAEERSSRRTEQQKNGAAEERSSRRTEQQRKGAAEEGCEAEEGVEQRSASRRAEDGARDGHSGVEAAGSRAPWVRGARQQAGWGDPPNWLFAEPTGWIVGPQLVPTQARSDGRLLSARAVDRDWGRTETTSGSSMAEGLRRGRFPAALRRWIQPPRAASARGRSCGPADEGRGGEGTSDEWTSDE